MQLFMDKALARRLERTEAAINASFVDARRRAMVSAQGPVGTERASYEPEWRDFSGTYAMFDGISSPMTQSFGLGLFEKVSAGELAAIEQFFRQRGAEPTHELCPLGGVETCRLLCERGYLPVEMSTVLVREIAAVPATESPAPGVTVRIAEPHEADLWIRTSVQGWAETEELAVHVREIAKVAFVNPAVVSFFAEHDGKPIATGSLGVHEGIALFAGASTVPGERGKGAQRALLAARLAEAARRDCNVALMAAEPGGTSQRNAERNGFRVAYTRTKWKL